MRRILRYLAVLVIVLTLTGYFSAEVSAAGTISLGASSGEYGTTVTVYGTGFNAAGESITITLGLRTVRSYTATAAAWSTTFSVPGDLTAGTYDVVATAASGTSALQSFTINTKMTLSYTTGAAGITEIATGFGFVSGEVVIIKFGGVQKGTATAGSTGQWSSVSFAIPAQAPGLYNIEAVGDKGSYNSVTFTLTSNSSISISPTNGTVGSSVTVTGTGFAANEIGVIVTYDGSQAGTTAASASGDWTVTFAVPASASGSHIIDARGAATAAISVPDQSFTVTPLASLSKDSAIPGTVITATGSGFAANESKITINIDGKAVSPAVTANKYGSWTTTFIVPAAASGSFNVDISGASTASSSVPSLTFTIGGGITISKSSGNSGTSLTVNGSGFAANESGITVTYDNNTVGSAIIANESGVWKSTFTVPPSPGGLHTIAASGGVTKAAQIPTAAFTVLPLFSINNSSGNVGSSVAAIGSGFGANEAGITIFYDGVPVYNDIKASASGDWIASFPIPASAAGSHTVKASGDQTKDVASLSFKVNTVLTTSISGPVSIGSSITVTGSGFAASSPLKITFDGIPLDLKPVDTSASGSFNQSITVPKTLAGSHTIKVADAKDNNVSFALTISNTPPSVPNPRSPADGEAVGLFGDITPTFTWSASTAAASSAITYYLQIDTDSEFSRPVLNKQDIASTRYTLSKAEALPQGKYYWRVKAVDAASNQSDWSTVVLLQSGTMSMALFIILIIVAVVIVILLLYILLLRPALKKRKAQAVAPPPGGLAAPEIVIPEVVNAEYRNIDADVPAKRRALPWRLALPQAPPPTKGGKVLSAEDQARLKCIIDFAKSLPLIEAGSNTKWLTELAGNGAGDAESPAFYTQLLKGETQLFYEPAWMRHPVFLDLQTLLEGQPLLQDLNSFVEVVNHTASEALQLLQNIFRDSTAEITRDIMADGGWEYISAVYTDALSWFLGKYLREPLDRDYTIKPEGSDGSGLYGAQHTPFAGLLIKAVDDQEASQLRILHLKLRRAYRSNESARNTISLITKLEVHRNRLLTAFSQFERLNS